MKTNPKHNDAARRATLSRRSFLTSATTAAASMAVVPTCLTSQAFGRPAGTPTQDILITVFLRGAMDGLSAVVPAGDPAYTSARSAPNPDLLVTPTVWLDSANFFGLNPAANALDQPWNDGKLALVHSTGNKDNGTRSHFDSQARMETGTGTVIPLATGWVGRALGLIPAASTGLRAATISSLLPRMYAGAPQTLPIADPATFAFPAPMNTEAFRKLHLDHAFTASPDPILGPAGLTTLSAIDDVEDSDTGNYGLGAGYPMSPLGEALRNIAGLMNSPHLVLEAAHVDVGGWDHHDSEGPVSGVFAALIADLADSMRAFYDDLAGTGINYTLVVQTEFGRRIVGNLSGGTDHGKGGTMFVMGPNVTGGGGVGGSGVITDGWNSTSDPLDSPLLAANNDAGDLPVAIDHREILGEICIDRLGLTLAQVEDEVFPGLVMPNTHWGVTSP